MGGVAIPFTRISLGKDQVIGNVQFVYALRCIY